MKTPPRNSQRRCWSSHVSFYRFIQSQDPCGYRSDPRRACSCTPPQVEKYLSKISGPLLDRIDLHVEVPAVPFTQLAEIKPQHIAEAVGYRSLDRSVWM